MIINFNIIIFAADAKKLTQMWYGDSDGKRAKDEEASEQPFQRFFPFFLLHTLTQYGPNDLDGNKYHQSVRNEHRHGKHETNQLDRVEKTFRIR